MILPTFQSVIVVLVTSVEITTVMFLVPLFRFPSYFLFSSHWIINGTDGKMLYFKLSCVYCCQKSSVYCYSCLVCIVVSCLVCIVVVFLCVLLQLSYVYCCQLSCVYCCQLSCVYFRSCLVCIFVILCVFAVLCVYCSFYFIDAGLLTRSLYSEGPATGHLDTGFSWFPCVYKQLLRWFPRFQVATTFF